MKKNFEVGDPFLMIPGIYFKNRFSKFDKKTCFSASALGFSSKFPANYSRNVKNKNLKIAFSKIGLKMSIRRPQSKFLLYTTRAFLSKCGKNFRGR